MKKYKILFQGSPSIPVVIVFFCLAFLAASVWSSGARSNKQQDKQRDVTNKTTSFQLVSAETTTDSLILEMKNGSTKGVIAFIVSFGRGLNIPTDYTIGDVVVVPGEIVQEEYPLSYLSNLKEQKVAIAAVVFDDRSSEGDSDALEELRSEWLGEKIQLKRINRLLRKAAKLRDMDNPTVVAKLKSEISLLSEDQDAGRSWHVHVGLSMAKQRALYLLNQLDQWHQLGGYKQQRSDNGFRLQGELSGIANIREGIGKIIQYQHKRISRY